MDDTVKTVVRTITEAIRPVKVFLFGSRAEGNAKEDSDIDLLILYAGPKSPRDVQVHIHRLFPRPGFSLDVFVLTPEDFERQKGVANTLAREVSERGILCHG